MQSQTNRGIPRPSLFGDFNIRLLQTRDKQTACPYDTRFAYLAIALLLFYFTGCSQPTRVVPTMETIQPEAADSTAPSAKSKQVDAQPSTQKNRQKQEAKQVRQRTETANKSLSVGTKGGKAKAKPLPSKSAVVKQITNLPVDMPELSDTLKITDVATSTPSFNPTQGEEVGIYYTLSKDAEVTIQIFDPDHGLIRTIVEDEPQKIGKHQAIWDGKDLDGNIVPNEAYFFTIDTKDANGNRAVYDPVTISGGESHDITSANINRAANTLSYKMPETGRVSIRIGTRGGPLLNTLVDWQPRLKGEVTEYWNGKDQDGLINLRDRDDLKMVITYFTLPENSIITYGSKDKSYRDYKRIIAKDRPKKPAHPRIKAPAVQLSPHYGLPRTIDYSPKLKMTFPTAKETDDQGRPILSGRVLVHVEFDDADKPFFKNQQYEVAFFLDTIFYAEEEMGYSPYNWVWNISGVKEGKHVLTVNMSGFKDQIGVLSKEVVVKNARQEQR